MKNDYIKKLAERNQQKAKVLIARPDFQKEVKKLRKKWKIPSNGIPNEEKRSEWQELYAEMEEEWYKKIWNKRRDEVVELNKAGKIYEAEDLKKDIFNTNPINALRIDVKMILKKYRLPLRWKDGIKNYLLSSKPESIAVPVGPTIVIKWDEDTGIRIVSIEIDDSITLETIKKSWKHIMYERDRLYSRTQKKFQPIKNFDRDREAYDLHTKGKTAQEIADILSEKKDRVYSYDDVFSFIKRYKKRLASIKLN